VANVQDLSRFMMMVFGGGELDGQRILRAETIAEMLSPQNSDVPLDLGARWGLGWWLLPIVDYAGQNAWHSGGDGAWNSLLVTLPTTSWGRDAETWRRGDVVYQIAGAVLEQALKVKTGIERPPAATQPSFRCPLMSWAVTQGTSIQILAGSTSTQTELTCLRT
jgi:hypothetical protein